MNEEKIIRMDMNGNELHKHTHINENPDSLEISTPSRGGSIKVYGDFSKPEEFRKKIDEAIGLRKYAQEKIGE